MLLLPTMARVPVGVLVLLLRVCVCVCLACVCVYAALRMCLLMCSCVYVPLCVFVRVRVIVRVFKCVCERVCLSGLPKLAQVLVSLSHGVCIGLRCCFLHCCHYDLASRTVSL